MSINELPDDCLFSIYHYIDDLDDLLNCYKVCRKWNQLIAHRLSKVRYLTGSYRISNANMPDYALDTIYFQKQDRLNEKHLGQLLPNIKILDISYPFHEKLDYDDVISFISQLKSIVGIAYIPVFYEGPVINFCTNLEMVATDWVEDYLTNHGTKIKQLYLWNCTLDTFREKAEYFPNLKRLHIQNNEGHPDRYYNGPILKQLEIVELKLSSYDGTNMYYGFQFMDSCPSLKSAHLNIDSSQHYINGSVINYNMQDLVINYLYERQQEWPSLRTLLMKYPNLKHLALRQNTSIRDEHIEQLLGILPNLILLDLRGSTGITKRSVDWTEKNFQKCGRTVQIYINQEDEQIYRDWSNLSMCHQRICREFDFMKNCFLKSFYRLPLLMDLN